MKSLKHPTKADKGPFSGRRKAERVQRSHRDCASSQNSSETRKIYHLKNRRISRTYNYAPFPATPETSGLFKRRKQRRNRGRKTLFVYLALVTAAASMLGLTTMKNRSTNHIPGAFADLQAATEGSGSAGINIALIAPLRRASTIHAVPLGEVFSHISQRLEWTNATFHMSPIDIDEISAHQNYIESADMVLVTGVDSMNDLLTAIASGASNFIALDGAPNYSSYNKLQGSTKLTAILEAVEELYQRATSDDLLFAILILINESLTTIPEVSSSTKAQQGDLSTLLCMVTNCGSKIVNCLLDKSCRTALGCLNNCKYNDQVCSYRCIASYESPALQEFSLCILQKHNCLGLSASIPMIPNPDPLPDYKGQMMTHELAEDLLRGWLDPPNSLFSWKIFSGKNPAYDYFPNQYQIFYNGKAKNTFWYDPVFTVKTLDGKEVWRRRHYRVRRGQVPGTFFFSVLDNGVVSDEFWRILDCDENLEWCIFYYSGAASAAGITYSGAVLGSYTGDWPVGNEARSRIVAVLAKAGIKEWELSNVEWNDYENAPLSV